MRFTIAILLTLALATAARAADEAGPQHKLSFQTDVMAVIAKAGCNAGACHGNKNGKGGFKLSLRGQDPDLDYATLTRDLFARRTNPFDPDQSLILQKATAQLAHEGGVRFRVDAPEYKLLRQWIAAGLPWDEHPLTVTRLEVTPAEQVLIEPARQVQIQATAVFSDGSRRDVTSLAVYEQSTDLARISHDGLVQPQRNGELTVVVRFLQSMQPVRLAFVPARPDFAWKPVPANNYVDEHVLAKLKTLRINPSSPCDDGTFVR